MVRKRLFLFFGAHETKQVACDLAHLDLFAAFRDAITAMVTINVLKRFVAGIPDPTMHLHRTIGCVATKSVRPVIAH